MGVRWCLPYFVKNSGSDSEGSVLDPKSQIKVVRGEIQYSEKDETPRHDVSFGILDWRAGKLEHEHMPQ